MEVILFKVIKDTLQITVLVTVMMILVDAIYVWSRGKAALLVRGKKNFRQYLVSSFIGTIPGCIGGFTNVSLYIHGLISFGALAGSMIAVSGDEAFVMLAIIPETALILFAILFLTGIAGGILIDFMVKRFNIPTCKNCAELIVHEKGSNLLHYLKEHIYEHIIKKHIWKTALWTFAALLFVEIGLQYLDIGKFTSEYKIVFLLLGALIGLIPESGPHIIFVMLFARGLVPFSVLLTSSIVQDGHGMLPMLSYSFSDSVKVKLFNFTIGIVLGLILFVLGF